MDVPYASSLKLWYLSFSKISFIQWKDASFHYNLPYADTSFCHIKQDTAQKSDSPYSRPLTIQGQAQRENREKELRKNRDFFLLVEDNEVQQDGEYSMMRSWSRPSEGHSSPVFLRGLTVMSWLEI